MLSSEIERRKGRRAVGVLIAVVLLLPLALGFVAYFLLHRAPTAPVAVTPEAGLLPPPIETPTPLVLPTVPPRADLPKLEASDEFLRDLAALLSANPLWAKWLVNEGLARRFVAVVDNVAEGRSPNAHVPFLAPTEPFRARERGDAATIDPSSFRRYDAIAEVIASLDAQGLAKLYGETHPLVDRAYRDLGYANRPFDDTLAKAIRSLLATPQPAGELAIRRGVKSWKLAAPSLETLTPAQKQLLRTGPDNVKKIKQKLREIAEALGIPPS